jgi:hypothetical protein
MSNRKLVISLSLASVLVASCTNTPVPIPVAKNHPYSEQHIMQAAHHWDVLAADVAEKVYRRLNSETFSQPAAMINPAPAPMMPAPSPAPSVSAPPPAPMGSNAPAVTTFDPNNPSASFNQYSASRPVNNSSYTPLDLYQGVGGQPVATQRSTLPAPPPTTAPAGMAMPAPMAIDPGFTSASAVMQTGGIPPLFIRPPAHNAPVFDKTFFNLLRSRLLQNDLMVVSRSDGPYNSCYAPNVPCRSLVVDYAVNVVNHKARLPKHVTLAGSRAAKVIVPAALLGSAAWMIDKGNHWGEKAWALLPLSGFVAMAAEYSTFKELYFPDETATEVAVTTTVSDGDFVIFSDTSIYYIHTGDQDHYEKGTSRYRVVSK